MPTRCCVPGCNNRKGGHLFPTETAHLMKWRVAIKRINPRTKNLWMPNLSHDRVCADHFLQTDYRSSNSEVKRLKVGVVPSIFSHNKISKKPKRRRRSMTGYPSNDNLEQHNTNGSSQNELANGPISVSPKKYEDAAVQCQFHLPRPKLRINSFIHDEKAMQYFTGFDNYHQFTLFNDIVTYELYSLEYSCTLLSGTDQLFLTLVKLRQSLDHELLAYMFGLSVATVSKIFNAWINHMYRLLKKLPIWPSRKVVSDTMPDDFKKLFPTTRVIIDSTEIPIEKPSNIQAQQETFSTYKNRNTIKVLIGITPKGAVSFISDCYGGAASDRSIIERSALLSNCDAMFEKKDSIMADKGFLVQDLFANFDVEINIPTFMRGRTRLPQAQRLSDAAVSSKRVHVERIIGYAKTYKIIHGVLPYNLLHLSNKIVFICFMLVNFRKPIC